MKIKTITPVGRAVLFKVTKLSKVRGIHLPEKFQGQTAMAQVLAVGPDVTRCKVGDYVMFGTRGKILDADFNDPSLSLIESDESVIAVVEYEEESRIVTLGEVAQA